MLCCGKMDRNLLVLSSLIRSFERASSVRDITLNFNSELHHSGYLNLMVRVVSRDLGIERTRKKGPSFESFQILKNSLFFHLISQFSTLNSIIIFGKQQIKQIKLQEILSTNPSLREVVKNLPNGNETVFLLSLAFTCF